MESADPRRRRRSVRITERDRELLAFAAEHRLVLADHVQKLLGVSGATAYARLRALTVAGMLSQRTVFHHRPGCYQITRTGLGLIGSQLPRPGLNLNCYDHDVGVAWLWLAARAGTFGAQRAVLSERWLRSHDASPDGRAQPYAVRLGGLGANDQPRLHYPDLLLVDPTGRRIALELELTPKGRTRREKILGGYGADRNIDVVVYLTDQDGIARSVQASAARLGISDRVHVQYVDQPNRTRAASASAAVQRARPTGERARAKPERTPAKREPARGKPGRTREIGTSLLLATQELADLDRAARGLRDQVLGNTAVKIVHRQDVPSSAQTVAQMAGTKKAWEQTYQVGQGPFLGRYDTGRGTRRQVEQFVVHPNEIRSLRTGDAVLITKMPKATARTVHVARPRARDGPELG